MSFNLIQILAPANFETGGPESLHNLCRLTNDLGIPCEMVYYPYGNNYSVPPSYQKYRIDCAPLKDREDVLMIFPEVFCMPALRIKKARVLMWWLSVDSFLENRDGKFSDKLRYFRRALKRKRPILGIRSLRGLQHLSKCFYDKSYLSSNGIDSMLLSGPISRYYTDSVASDDYFERENSILYNPRKGSKIMDYLMSSCPDYIFKPLVGLSESQLRSAYRRSKLYVDFGSHPGQERMPREAVASGCCIITGRRGSAANPYDIPIDNRYKIDDSDPDILCKFRFLVDDVFSNYGKVWCDFENYRREVLVAHDSQREDWLKILESLGMKYF